MGDVGHVYIKLRKGSCRIDWGDGKSTPLFTYKEDWLSANHTYPPGCKISKEQFEITITSLEDNIIGFRADSGEMMVTDVDIRECQSLEYLSSSWLIEKLDITTNPAIKEIDVSGDAADLVDLSQSTGLESLTCRFCKRKTLNLSRCNRLVYLDCRNNYSLKKLAISNRSVIKEVLLYDTELDERSMKYLEEAIERNEGEIKMTERMD
jgi:hypothetical protein